MEGSILCGNFSQEYSKINPHYFKVNKMNSTLCTLLAYNCLFNNGQQTDFTELHHGNRKLPFSANKYRQGFFFWRQEEDLP